MYHYDYEEYVLLILRMAKYLYHQDPAALRGILAVFDVYDVDAMSEMTESLIWEICPDVVFEDDDENGICIATFSHPVINRFCVLSMERSRACGGSVDSWQRKLCDAVEFYLKGTGYSVWELECRPHGNSAEIRALFSPDCYRLATALWICCSASSRKTSGWRKF